MKNNIPIIVVLIFAALFLIMGFIVVKAAQKRATPCPETKPQVHALVKWDRNKSFITVDTFILKK